MATLGGLEIHVITETPTYAVEVTQHPVEQGINLTDHVEPQPTVLTLEGKILGPNAGEVRSKLITAMKAAQLLTYSGRNTFIDCLLVSFDAPVDYKTANGLAFTATLQEVRIAKSSSYENVPDAKEKSQVKTLSYDGEKQVQSPASPPIYHTVRRGQTFYEIAAKYGTSWPAVKALNPGVDPTRLQIGQEVRVK